MFLHMSVCHSVHREVPAPVHAGIHLPLGRYTPWAGTPPGQVHPLGRYTSRQVHLLRYDQQAGGTHPTGMQSCLRNSSNLF